MNFPHVEINSLNLGFVYDNTGVIVLPNSSCVEPHGRGKLFCFIRLSQHSRLNVIVSWNKCLPLLGLHEGSDHAARLQLTWDLQVGCPFHPWAQDVTSELPAPRFHHSGLQRNGKAFLSCPGAPCTEKTSSLSAHNLEFPTCFSISSEIKMTSATHDFLTAQPGSTVTICLLHRRMYLGTNGRDIVARRNQVQIPDEMQTNIQMSNPLGSCFCLSTLLGVNLTGFLKG